ncbi:MAG: hypothetical protein ACXVCE_15715 [Bacteriovorax sp.]
MELESFLRKIISDSHLHARWLNSLSYLEYRGFRKIARSQKTEDITDETLLHLQEEVRHSLFLKKLAQKIGGQIFSHYDPSTVLVFDNLKNYFYHLDSTISSGMDSPVSSYQATSIAIEKRAMLVYKTYEKILREFGSDISIAPLIEEEERHLEHFLQFQAIDRSSIEKKCFQDLWINLEQEVL